MKPQMIGRREILKTVGAGGAASVLAVVSTPQPGQGDEQEGSKSLAGTWFETDEGPGFKFGVLMTVGVGGGLVATADIDSIKNANLLGSPTHGAWVKTGGASCRRFGKALSLQYPTGRL